MSEPIADTTSMRERIRVALGVVAARLRFFGILAAALAIVGGWETIRAGWDRLTARPAAGGAISPDTEYFCPMDPGILSDWPSKCPICHMTLVRRKKGEAAPLPDGVLARMQFTPYRLWLGGIRTGVVDYAPLARTIEAPGTVDTRGIIRAEFFADEADWLRLARDAEIISLSEPHVATVVRATVEAIEEPATLVLRPGSTDWRPGEPLRVRVTCPIEGLAPFRDLPSQPPPLAQGELRTLYACMEHRDVARESPGRCPRDQATLMPMPLRDNQRLRWWCPMHPEVTADRAGATCAACGGMVLVPRIVSYRPPGSVLGVPASAVVDHGDQGLVYVEHGDGMFDAVAVRLGPRCGESYPVIGGLEPGDRVAVQGAFLIDAETRLNPGLAAAYFGAGPRPTTGAPHHETGSTSRSTDPLESLPAADRPLARLQRTCPVTGKPLGSMGVPPRVEVRGRPVFLCCKGCSSAIENDPEKYLARLPAPAADRP